MLGLMLKDFYETFLIKKNLISWLCTLLLFGVVFFVMTSDYIVILLVAVSIPMMGVSPLQFSIEQDEISKFDQILLTYPISKKQIVLTKFLETHLINACFVILLSLPIILIATYGCDVIDLQLGLIVLAIGIIFSLIMLPINNVIFMLLGSKKGAIAYLILFVAVAIAYVTLNFIFGIEQLSQISLNDWMMYAVVLAVVLNVLGYFSCVKIYELKHS